ncbi:MAG: phage baseplate assembly protein V [Azonexus sp.]|jgi:phage baseplate assembly protein V|nr:phage baseplate assembly protein V [Azonexus sp.]
MTPRDVLKLLAPTTRRLRLLASRAVLSLLNDGPGVQIVQVKLLAGEVRSGVERIQQYGLTTAPHAGAEAVFLSLGADRDHGVVIALDDRRYRLKNLRNGEVALYDDLGHKVHLTRDGIVIDGAGQPITLTNTPLVRAETPMFQCTGEIMDLCDSAARTMSGMRAIYDSHHHTEQGIGGPTTPPLEPM